MRISHATQPAPASPRNEDLVVTGPDFAVVLDGATPMPGVDTGCVHTVPWLTRRLGSALARLLLTRSDGLADTLRIAIESVVAEHADTCDLANPDSPSSTVTMLRERHDAVDYLVLADSPIVFGRRDGSIDVIHDDRLERLPGWTVEIVRDQRNTPGGFWVASTDPAAADEALTGSIDRERLDRAGLFTDGATRLVERHGLRWVDVMNLLDEDGPAAVIERVRHADERAAGHYPGKVHDDATAVSCRL
jgi:hypothetical protein